jgi:hypothetical protein
MPVTNALISPENQEFLKWVKDILADEQKFQNIRKICLFELSSFYSKDPEILKKKLLDKMTLASGQYPSPIMEHYDIIKEQQFEMIDLIGWKLVEMYNIHKMKGSRAPLWKDKESEE